MNGYTEITLGGKQVGLRFGYPAVRWFSEDSRNNQDIYFMPGKDDFSVEGFAKLVQCSYRNNCLVKEVQPELTYADFIEWTEAAEESEMQRLLQVYLDSTLVKGGEEEKKSLTDNLENLTLTESNESVLENSTSDPGNLPG